MRLLRSTIRKLARRPATIVTYLLLIGLNALIMLAVAAAVGQSVDPQSALASRMFLTFPGAWTLTLAIVMGLGGMLSLTYGAAIAGSEWTWGTLKAAVARGEGRAWYVLTGIAGVVVMSWVAILLAYAAGIVGVFTGAGLAHVSSETLMDADTARDLALLGARSALAIAMDASIGFAIATVARSQLAGIGVGIALYIGEGVMGIFVPWIIKWAPFAASSAMLSGGSVEVTGSTQVISSSQLDPGLATIVVAAWLVLAAGFAALWTERAEIGG
jgi:ABC-2 type transport system permease protein